MKYKAFIYSLLIAWSLCLPAKAQTTLLPVCQKALNDKTSIQYVDFKNYPSLLRDLPIGVFDSGTGGFTVLERILRQDRFNNETGEEKPDGIPDFQNENFEYLADQANMPYGRYDREGKADYLRELAVKDALFLLKGQFWKDNRSQKPEGQKSPVKIIVIACNTATAYGLEHIQQLLAGAQSPVKVIGVVNAGAQSALESIGNKPTTAIGVLATEGTISSGVYERTLSATKPAAMQLSVVSQPGYGFAEAVDEEKEFVDRSLTTFSANYRGPKLGKTDGDIDPDLIDAYNFDTTNNQAFIERDSRGRVTRIQLNSADNYARFNLLCLLERARKQNIQKPIDRIILGCTHYPFAIETLKKHLIELKSFQDKTGHRPYARLISDDCEFIDPAVGTAYECYKTLLADHNLNDIGNQGTLEPYISVASALLPSECLDKDGNLTYAFKYGRNPGSEDITTMFVPFSEQTVSADNLSRIKRLLPLCAAKISDFMDRNTTNEQVAAKAEKDPFTPWTLFVDAGMITLLLLIGKFIRVKVKWVQRLFIPPSLIAGFLGLALGPNGIACIPLSENTGTYASILIACIFGCLPFTTDSSKASGNNIGRMWVYSQVGMLAQWTLGGLMGICVLRLFWPELNSAFGLSMPAGYCGGHGTAAALGAAFQTYNYDDMLTLAMTAATVGIIGSVVIGLLIVKRGTQKGYTSFLTSFSELPAEYRAGLLPEEKRMPLGKTTTSSISIDSLTFNFSVVMAVALGGYGLSKLVQLFLPQLSLPVFSCAFIAGIIVASLFRRTGVIRYICPSTIGHLSGTFTDILVACGIASIKLSVVLQNLVPLLILLVTGLVCTAIYIFGVARRIIPDYWFEKAMFSWGWFTGTMAMGIALLRVVDPDHRSHCLEDYALAYLFIAPVEISLVTFAPLAFMNGQGWLFIGICAAALLAVLMVGKAKGWLSGKQAST
jgi:ESS family glutamate:Na+ symporter